MDLGIQELIKYFGADAFELENKIKGSHKSDKAVLNCIQNSIEKISSRDFDAIESRISIPFSVWLQHFLLLLKRVGTFEISEEKLDSAIEKVMGCFKSDQGVHGLIDYQKPSKFILDKKDQDQINIVGEWKFTRYSSFFLDEHITEKIPLRLNENGSFDFGRYTTSYAHDCSFGIQQGNRIVVFLIVSRGHISKVEAYFYKFITEDTLTFIIGDNQIMLERVGSFA